MAGLTDRPTGGYPNRFNVPKGWTLDGEVAVEPRQDEGTQRFVDSAARFIGKGATLVGGCCGIRPEDIAALAEFLRNSEAEPVTSASPA